VFREVELATIRNNNYLSLTTTKKDVDRTAKTIRDYGLLTPLVIHPDQKGGHVVISGECELEALRKIGMKKIEAVVVDCTDNIEANKLSLLLSSLRKEQSPISEGLMLKNLLKTDNYTQSDIAYLVGKSVSWVSKRIALIERLNDSVLELVAAKKLCCHTAQEIARLPSNIQHQFGMKVVQDKIPKSGVEKLVVSYNNLETSKSIKQTIASDPKEALELMNELKIDIRKTSKKNKEGKTAEDKMLSALRLLFKVINEVELILTEIEFKDSQNFTKYLTKAFHVANRFSRMIKAYQNGLLENEEFSPGKMKNKQKERKKYE
jgi:ParB family chromosome partitioning protein